MKIITKAKLLTVCIFFAQQSYALELLHEKELSNVSGQDGLIITHEISRAEIDQVNWYDPNPVTNQQMGLGLHNVVINGVNDQSILSQLSLDVGATDKGAGLRIETSISPFDLIADLNIVKKQCTNGLCTPIPNLAESAQSLGQLGVSTRTPIGLVLQTTAGLFNRDEIGYINFQLQNVNILHKLGNNGLKLNDLNFNFSGTGYMYLSQEEGIVLATNNGTQDHYIELGRVIDTTDVTTERANATNPGMNLDLRYQSGNQTKNIMRLGASGALTNARLALNANQEGITDFGQAGQLSVNSAAPDNSYNGVGQGGLHLSMSAEFSSLSDANRPEGMAPTTFEIGHTGKNSYAIEFSNLRPLTTHDAAGNLHLKKSYIDFGDIYINTVQANSLSFLINEKIKKTLGLESNIVQQILSSDQTNSDVALIAIRDMDFQSIAAKARFISDNSLAALTGNGGTWGIGIPIYNLNANIALSGARYGENESKQGIAYNLAASTEGYGIDKKTNLPSTTSIILIDGQEGEHNEAVNYYAGLRNIDAFIQSKGIIGYEDDGIYIQADQLLIAANAEVAIGQLPGSKYNCVNGTASNCGELVSYDNFAKRDDVLTNIAFKLDGNGELKIIPGVDPVNTTDSNFLSLEANFKFRPLTSAEKNDPNNLGSYFSLSNIDGEDNDLRTSALSLNRMEGHLDINGNIRVSADTVKLDNQIKFNHEEKINQSFRTNFAMMTNDKMQNMASVAITGGALRSTLGIKPR